MQLEEAIFAKLSQTPAVIDLLAPLPDLRVYPGQAPKDPTFPFTVYSEASQATLHSIDGYVINLPKYRMRLETYGKTYPSVKRVGKAISDTLVGFQGTISYNGETLYVAGIFGDDANDGLDQPVHDEEQEIFMLGLDLSIHYNA